MCNSLLSLRNLIFVFAGMLCFSACTTDDISDTTPTTQNADKAPIGFGSYLSRSAQTRGTAVFEPADVALNGGIGIFAMYTNGRTYNPDSTTEKDTTKFSDNFMQNINLGSELSKEDLKNGKGDASSSWSYAPLRYWPITANEYVSFMAYSPYKEEYGTLYNKNGETKGDQTYIKHTVNKDPRNQTDLMYADASKIANMQLFKNQDGSWTKTGDFAESTDNSSTPKVNLKLKHATSRIGFVVTSSALKDPNNFFFEDQNGKVYKFGDLGQGIEVDMVSTAFSNTSITVNKVMFLGDNSSAGATPKGAFYSNGYLNLSKTLEGNTDETKNKPLWVVPSNVAKQAFTFDNTLKTSKGEDSIRTTSGEYNGSFRGTVTLKNGGESGNLLWYPADSLYSKSYGKGQYIGYIAFGWQPLLIYADWDETKSYFESLLSNTKDSVSIRSDGKLIKISRGEYYARGLGLSTPVTNEVISNYISSVVRKQWTYWWKYQMETNRLEATWNEVESGKPITDGLTVNAIGNSANDYMFVIPQDFSAGKDDLWVYLDYTVNYGSGVSGEVKEKGINYKVYKKVEKKFEPGKAYIIVMDIGEGNNFNTINFSVKTDNWADEEGIGAQF